MAIRNTYKTYERLKREQHIDTLFRTGKAFSVLQLRMLYLLVPREAELSPVRAGFSVPKKKFRKSVHRHRIRRLMIEAWRINKHELYASVPEGMQLHLFIIYTPTVETDLLTLQETMQQAIARLMQEITKHA